MDRSGSAAVKTASKIQKTKDILLEGKRQMTEEMEGGKMGGIEEEDEESAKKEEDVEG